METFRSWWQLGALSNPATPTTPDNPQQPCRWIFPQIFANGPKKIANGPKWLPCMKMKGNLFPGSPDIPPKTPRKLPDNSPTTPRQLSDNSPNLTSPKTSGQPPENFQTTRWIREIPDRLKSNPDLRVCLNFSVIEVFLRKLFSHMYCPVTCLAWFVACPSLQESWYCSDRSPVLSPWDGSAAA